MILGTGDEFDGDYARLARALRRVRQHLHYLRADPHFRAEDELEVFRSVQYELRSLAAQVEDVFGPAVNVSSPR